MLAITNCKFFSNNELITGKTILINNGKIAAITNNKPPIDCQVINGQQNYLVPGFIDLQIYGSGGNLFSAYPTTATLAQMDANLISKGTMGFLACVATNSTETMYNAITAAKNHRENAKSFLGLHLEGPYLNPLRKGAHVTKYIKRATLDEVKSLINHADGVITMMTIAPELQDDSVITYLLVQNIVLSIGHSDASYEQAMAAYVKGITTTTHLFNAMPSIHHRSPNLPMAALNHPTAMASIIADGNHVNFELIKMSHKLMQDRLFLITDAVTACQTDEYQHRLIGDKFVTADGTLSGANITLLQAVKNCVNHCGIGIADAINMATLYPAKVINQHHNKGKIEVGYIADLLLLSPELNLVRVLKA